MGTCRRNMANTARQIKVYTSGRTDLNVEERPLLTKNDQAGHRRRKKYLPHLSGGTDKIMTMKIKKSQ